MERPLALVAFDGQRPLEHALTVVGALAVFWLGYFGAVAAVYGDVSVLATEASISQQRVGGVVGSVLVWTYFGLAFVRGSGGPVLNAVVYPLAIVVFAPFLARWALFGPDLAGLADRFIGLFVFEPLVTVVLAVVPGLGAFVAVLSVWAATISEGERREWERRTLPESFYEEFVAQEYE
jgi:hypothetical protein